ncbi:MAG: beta-lactamase family protein [Kordiimonadaceae bacterium]|jgi:CubicO group peptidase (beta-lactamase class C family)|nr:beta-lactamase family protein [Kordiimonadaceae bacterium]MBT6329787.1 beta-lactamase family protein [Kordiimonadaceae bacterium]MBT7582317.1 beta-lactamase family protein [Kordiimonadaceae bacterium]
MKKIVMVLIMGLLTACGSEKTLDEKLAEVDQIFTAYDSAALPGAAVMIIENGEVILQKGYGMAHFATNSPVTAKSNFRLASATKQFTAMSILQLVEKGELSLDTSLTDIFETFPDYGKTITIEHLLQHTSGIADYGPMGSMDVVRQFKDKDVLDFTIGLESADFPVGEKHEYSNTAYVVLTQVLEKITSQTFRDYLKENIFDPVGMENTLAFENGINEVSNRVYGYSIEEEGILETDQNKWSALLGDGGIYSNLEDLYKWDQVLYTDKLLGQKYMDMSFTNHKINDGSLMDYGYGWRIETYKGMDILYHTGSSIGFRNILYRIPSKNFSAVILTNRDAGGEFSTLVSVHKVVDVFF